MSTKAHWENIYTTKQPTEVSWTQPTPEPSLSLIQLLKLKKEDAIIDIGGGDSHLVDVLLDLGYSNLTVLDISGEALKRAKQRLGARAQQIKWIEQDIRDFTPTQQYAIWHDRAAFHFLTDQAEIIKYVNLVNQYASGGVIIGTFSDDGPLKCSGLEVSRYSPEELEQLFSLKFPLQKAYKLDHETPFATQQNFSFYAGSIIQ